MVRLIVTGSPRIEGGLGGHPQKGFHRLDLSIIGKDEDWRAPDPTPRSVVS